MEAICSFETSVETQRTTRRRIPEDDNLHNHRYENLKSYEGAYVCNFLVPPLKLKRNVINALFKLSIWSGTSFV
jgi:hypothetical protein